MDNIKTKRGFTLIEALIAVVLFSTALVAVLSVVGRSSDSKRLAQSVTVADYLGQGLLETVRNIRDTNFLSENDWLQGIDQCEQNGCTFDLSSSSPILVVCDMECPVHVVQVDGSWGIASSTSYGFGGYSGNVFMVRGNFSLFEDQLRVEVVVSVLDKGIAREVSRKRVDFYNWYKGGSQGDQLGECSLLCSIEPRVGRTIVTFNTLLSEWTTGIQESGPANVNLVPGDYNVFVQTHDSYPTRPSTPAQTNERWFIRFYGPGGYVSGDPAASSPVLESSSGSDLVDGTETACNVEPVGALASVPSGVVGVTATHESVRSGSWDSVRAVCAAFDKI